CILPLARPYRSSGLRDNRRFAEHFSVKSWLPASLGGVIELGSRCTFCNDRHTIRDNPINDRRVCGGSKPNLDRGFANHTNRIDGDVWEMLLGFQCLKMLANLLGG